MGLLGELRPVAGLERRLREAARLGFDRAIVPGAADAAGSIGARRRGSRRPVASLREAVEAALADRPPDAWRGGPSAMLGWRPRRTPRRGGRSATGGATQRPVIRNIRLLGIVLGGLIGLALARPAGLLVDPTAASR